MRDEDRNVREIVMLKEEGEGEKVRSEAMTNKVWRGWVFLG